MKIYNFILLAVSMLIFTSMSECNSEGPETIIDGTVTDLHTGEGYGNIPLLIVRRHPSINGSQYTDFDSVYTNNTGAYRLKFTPLIPGEYRLELYPDKALKKYGISNLVEYPTPPTLKLGGTNTNNFKVNKLVNLTINLDNSSDFGYTNFSLTDRPYYSIEYFTKGTSITKDTILNVKVPRFTPLKIRSYFFGGGKPEFSNIYELNALTNDSTIAISN